jgi:NAD(P)-dependent dehydrogenase (short-subunit alcohol dehydrogenase family)
VLQDKTIVVTGVASGIGAEIAAELIRQGGHVVGVDINEPNANLGAFYRADLSDPASIDDLVTNLPVGANGLCNVAGLPPTHFRENVLKVNLIGLKRLTLGYVNKLSDGASIVNIASLAGVGWPEAIPAIKASETELNFDNVSAFCDTHEIEGGRSYFFSKEALIAWTMRNRWTWRDRGIRMNAISPGPVDTPILKDFLETLGERAEEDMKTMDRPGRPTDIAPLAAFLCSDGSSWIRGTNIPCDGGMFSHIQCAMNDLL